jgi:anaerobic magnesium-protoporphyrin IX monomethyl ester cyclase
MGWDMRILFIWPNKDTFGCKPIGIALLIAELKRAGHEIELFDTSFIDLGCADYNQELTKRGYFKPVDYGVDVSKKPIDLIDELDKKIHQFKPELFCISALSDEVDIACRIISHLENTCSGAILVGNKGAKKIQQMRLDEKCVYFLGEAVDILPSFINRKDYRYTRVQYPHGYFKNLDSLPYLDWTHFDHRHFLRAYDGKVYHSGDHMIGWGCSNSCTYCINEYWRELHGGMRGCMRRYSVKRIINELRFLTQSWNLDFYKFHDEDFLLKPLPYFRELAIEYDTHIRLPFSCMTNAKSVTPDRVALLQMMGCVSVSIGIEAGNSVMRTMLNRRETPDEIIRAVHMLHDAGIRVSSFNMIGLPFETSHTIEDTIQLNRKAGIKYPNISFFIPLEGTRLYDISVAAGFYKPLTPVSTNRPSLKMPSISEKELFYYYDNFHHMINP